MGKRVGPNQPKKGKSCESRRLVEYFVVVSTRAASASGTSCGQENFQCSLRGNAAQTKSRQAIRRAHMPGETANGDFMRLSSIADCSTISTSSTCGSEETASVLKKDPEIVPSSLSLDPLALDAPKTASGCIDCLLEPFISARYPAFDRPQHPLNPRLPQFCHPEGAEYSNPTTEYKMPRVHHFALNSNAGILYATCLTFHEEYTVEGQQEKYYAPRTLCLLSSWPYLSAFRTYLTQLYRLATTTNLMQAPIERYVLNICEEVPAPQPGEFEVQLSILNNTIRFWAPPANQPIAYVSLQFERLFECLDLSNVLYTWYSMVCERKIIFVSDQLSLLTVCAEILLSLLFPMKWSHLYIPLLPRSLSAMLDAPMPYLCGISRENFQYAVGDIGDDVIVVDLDRNVITLGSSCDDLPPIPHKEKVKLENSLQKNAGHVFWSARGIALDQVGQFRRSDNSETSKKLHSSAQAFWSERIRAVDDAFDIAPSPESVLCDKNDDSNKQSRWDNVQESFLNFFAASLKDYKKFMPKGLYKKFMPRGFDRSKHTFNSDGFVLSARRDFKPFLECIVSTQAFDEFISRRMYSSAEPDVEFFDKTIDAHMNKSILKVNSNKAGTAFLNSANAHRSLHKYTAIQPNQDDVPASEYSIIGSHGYRVYKYASWPDKFDTTMFGSPRPFPKDIAAEFKRTITLSGGRFFVVPRDPFEEYHQRDDEY